MCASLLGALLALASGLAFLCTGGPFRVSRYEVAGAQRISADAVWAASGLERGNLFLIRPETAATRIRAMPGIADADVHARLPDLVIIDVVEHAPLVAWKVLSTTTWLAADGGLTADGGEPPPLTLVDDAGAAADSSGRLSPQVLSDLNVLQAARPGPAVYYYGSLEGIYFRAPEGWTVYLGSQGRIAAKLALLQAMQREARTTASPSGRSSWSVIDLRIEGRAFVR